MGDANRSAAHPTGLGRTGAGCQTFAANQTCSGRSFDRLRLNGAQDARRSLPSDLFRTILRQAQDERGAGSEEMVGNKLALKAWEASPFVVSLSNHERRPHCLFSGSVVPRCPDVQSDHHDPLFEEDRDG